MSNDNSTIIPVNGDYCYLKVSGDDLQIVYLLDSISLPIRNLYSYKELFENALQSGPSNFRFDDFEIEKEENGGYKLSRENVGMTIDFETFFELSETIQCKTSDILNNRL